jgi:hypothetical protein
MSALLHRLAHRFGWTTGRVSTWYDLRGRLMVGFRCSACDRVEGIQPVNFAALTSRPAEGSKC